MVNFVGIECAREALATELHRQLKEDRSMCPACYFAHRTLARSIFRTTKSGQLVRGINKDLRAFDACRKRDRDMAEKARKAMKLAGSNEEGVSESDKRSIKCAIEDIRAGRVMTTKEFLKRHPGMK